MIAVKIDNSGLYIPGSDIVDYVGESTWDTITVPVPSGLWHPKYNRNSGVWEEGLNREQIEDKQDKRPKTSVWIDLPLSSGWSNSVNTMPAGYIKLSDGLVMLRGQVSKSIKLSTTEVIGILPNGYRPSTNRRFVSSNNSNVSKPILEINHNTGVISYFDLGTMPNIVNELLLSSAIFIAS